MNNKTNKKYQTEKQIKNRQKTIKEKAKNKLQTRKQTKNIKFGSGMVFLGVFARFLQIHASIFSVPNF